MTSDTTLPTLLIANLDCDDEYASDAGARPPMNATALARLSAAGTLLRCLARSTHDALWTPSPIAAAQFGELPLVRPRLLSGPLERTVRAAGPFGQVIAWGETATIARLRREVCAAIAPRAGVAADSESALAEQLATLPAADPTSAARANHRGFLLELAQGLDAALPGARLIRSIDALRSHLAAGGANASPTHSWVLKAVHSAAGRARIFGGTTALEAGQLAATTQLLAQHGELLFEPWMPRVDDFGSAFIVRSHDHELVSCHRQLVDRWGRFRGIEIPPGHGPGDPGLSVAEHAQWATAIAATARTLRTIGYVGPVTIDAWSYRAADETRKFQALGEINARLSVGVLARVLVDQLRACGLVPLDCGVRLNFTTAVARAATAAGRGVALLLPSAQNPTDIWLDWPNPGSKGTTRHEE
ncbi:MAG: hypothetical protein ACKVX7_03050 [Planctomycetota bacterium]